MEIPGEIRRQVGLIEPAAQLGMVLLECGPERAVVSIPPTGNRNDKGTLFAGSIFAVMVLCGWVLASHHAQALPGVHDVVIRDAHIDYLSPVRTLARATARLSAPPRMQPNTHVAFDIEVTLQAADEGVRAKLSGRYIALPKG